MTGTPVYWLTEDGTVEEHGGIFHLVLRSGGSQFTFVSPPNWSRAFAERIIREFAAFHVRGADVIDFPPGGREKRPRTPRRRKEAAVREDQT